MNTAANDRWRNLGAPERSVFAAAVLLACAGMASGCASHLRPLVPDRRLTLNGHALTLHFANAAAVPSRPLLVFSTGDAGMRRKDRDAYEHLASWGYPIVGFDSRDYVTHLGGKAETTTPARLADDYVRIIAEARDALQLPATRPVVLVGVSRGAGLSVVAAGELRASLAGVVAVALTQEEEYVQWYRRLRVTRNEPRRPVMVDVYDYLGQLQDLPLAVIQSTRDNYLPAAAARALFGPDTTRRWFQAIEARNHSFRGARARLYAATRSALAWIEGRAQGAGLKAQGSGLRVVNSATATESELGEFFRLRRIGNQIRRVSGPALLAQVQQERGDRRCRGGPVKAAGEETELEDRLCPAIEQPVDQPESTQSGYERLERGLSAVSAGLVRLERKLDRILALSIESRGRNRP